MVNTTKIPADQWINTAREALISAGIAGVRVDRLAKRLGVSRGGFYHNFKSREQLLQQLLNLWASENDFFPDAPPPQTPGEAVAYLNLMLERLLVEEGFSPAFDLAVREWARVDPKAKKFLDQIDEKRLDRLTRVFDALGCDGKEAPIRARVLYFHQIGFYAMGYHERQSKAERRLVAPIYLRIICGKRFLEAAEQQNRKWV